MIKIKLLTLIINISLNWHDAGHMIICNIARKYLTINQNEQIINLLRELESRIVKKTDIFIESCVMPDLYNAQFGSNFFKWHFLNKPVSEDNDKNKYEVLDNDNGFSSVAIINTSRDLLEKKLILKNKKMSIKFLSYLFRYLLHSFGDLHQPFHNVSYFSKKFELGDLGANFIKINFPEFEDLRNMHAIWDNCFILTPIRTYPYNEAQKNIIEKLTDDLLSKYPKEYFKDLINEQDPWKISDEGVIIAKKEVYDRIKDKKNVLLEKLDIVKYRKICEERIVLGGYRLHKVLDKLFK